MYQLLCMLRFREVLIPIILIVHSFPKTTAEWLSIALEEADVPFHYNIYVNINFCNLFYV
jgi:hypothetical protein